jgi:hypothetical protein
VEQDIVKRGGGCVLREGWRWACAVGHDRSGCWAGQACTAQGPVLREGDDHGKRLLPLRGVGVGVGVAEPVLTLSGRC